VPDIRLRYRRVGEGGVLFDLHTWETHILNPAAAAVYEVLREEFGDTPAANADVLRLLDELGLDPDAQHTRELLFMLERLGLVI
jgi:PqqD family protein of HPr-rel-A system